MRVHPTLLSSEGLPDQVDQGKSMWQERFQSIANLENHLYLNGTRIIKFYLHLSEEEQRTRFIERIDTPEKNWKFSQDDIKERKFWPQYRSAYEECMAATSTPDSPWYVVPADDKENTRLIVSRIILDHLEDLKMTYPVATPARKEELQQIRKQLKDSVIAR